MTQDATPEHSETSRFERVLGGWDVFVLSFGAMIGWGWIVLAGGWLADAGMWGAILALSIGGVAIALIGLVYAELASALPFAGGEHVYAERAFGSNVAFLCAWSIIFGYVSVVAFEAIALPVAIAYLFPEIRIGYLWTIAGYDVHLTEVLIGSAAAIIMTLLNLLGVRIAARAQALAILLLLAGGSVLVVGGVIGERAPMEAAQQWGGWAGVAAVMIMAPFLFVGFDVIPQSAEEIKGPRRDIGRMIVASVLAAVLFYIVVVTATAVAPRAVGGGGEMAAAQAASALWNSSAAGSIVVIAGICGILTSWNAFLIGGSRAIFALAKAGQLPGFLAAVHPRFKTPWAALALIGCVSAFAPLMGRSALVWIVDAGGFGVSLCYAIVAASFLWLRKIEPDLPRPFRAGSGPAVGVAALLLSGGVLSLYLPWSPASLVWPQEWGLLVLWFGAGGLLWTIKARRPNADFATRNE